MAQGKTKEKPRGSPRTPNSGRRGEAVEPTRKAIKIIGKNRKGEAQSANTWYFFSAVPKVGGSGERSTEREEESWLEGLLPWLREKENETSLATSDTQELFGVLRRNLCAFKEDVDLFLMREREQISKPEGVKAEIRDLNKTLKSIQENPILDSSFKEEAWKQFETHRALLEILFYKEAWKRRAKMIGIEIGRKSDLGSSPRVHGIIKEIFEFLTSHASQSKTDYRRHDFIGGLTSQLHKGWPDFPEFSRDRVKQILTRAKPK